MRYKDKTGHPQTTTDDKPSLELGRCQLTGPFEFNNNGMFEYNNNGAKKEGIQMIDFKWWRQLTTLPEYKNCKKCKCIDDAGRHGQVVFTHIC